jgi:hypothetical protein
MSDQDESKPQDAQPAAAFPAGPHAGLLARAESARRALAESAKVQHGTLAEAGHTAAPG